MFRHRLLRLFDAVFPSPVALAVALAGTTAAAVVVATTLPSDGPFLPDWVIWPIFLGLFPVHARTVRAVLPKRRDLRAYFLSAPRPLLVAATVAAACTFALVMHAVATARGNPERHRGGYYLRNHTDLTRVSRSEYRYAERLEERIFAGVALVFYLAGILVNAGQTARLRRVRA